MNKIYLLLILSLCVLSLSGQELRLEKQESYKYLKHTVLKKLRVKKPNFKKVELVLRIYYRNFKISKDKPDCKIFILEKYKDNSWKGKSYLLNAYTYKNFSNNRKGDSVTFKPSWTKTWETIVAKNYLNLPNELEASIKLNGEYVFVHSGEIYTIEILTKEVQRYIQYGSIEAKQKVYRKYNMICPALDEFADLIVLIKKEFNLNIN